MKKILTAALITLSSVAAANQGSAQQVQVSVEFSVCYEQEMLMGKIALMNNGMVMHTNDIYDDSTLGVESGVLTYYKDEDGFVQFRANLQSVAGGSYNTFVSITDEEVLFHTFPTPRPFEKPFQRVACPQ